MNLLRKLFFLLDRAERLHFFLIFLGSFAGALLETTGLGLLIPFFEYVADPSSLEKYGFLKWIEALAPSQDHTMRTIAFAILLAAFFFAKNAYLGLMNYLQARFIYRKMLRMSKDLFASYLAQPYMFFLKKNTSDLMTNIGRVNTVFSGVVLPLMTVMIELMVSFCIALLLLRVSWRATALVTLVVGVPTYFFYRLSHQKLRSVGVERERFGELSNRWLIQGLAGIKETKILGRERFFLDTYASNAEGSFMLAAVSQIVSLVPKLLIESIAVSVMIGAIVYLVLQGHDIKELLPTLGIFIVAAGRVMPSLSRLVSQLALVRLSKIAVDLVLLDYDPSAAAHLDAGPARALEPTFRLKRSLEIRNLSFRYENASGEALRDLSLTLKKGESLGLIGASGAGKTTLVDLVLGLLQPSSGGIFVDGVDITSDIRGWQRNIGYIPQVIYLTDDTIRRNIAFGRSDSEISDEKIWAALEMAKLADFVRSLPEQLGTMVGERGARLSGGQRQRIGIARALYHEPDFLILDEATSALDNETERDVTLAIEGLTGKVTLIVIAHRLTTVEKCTRLCRLSDGKLIECR